MKLGFIGFGEVSYEISKGLKKEGLSGIIAFDPMLDDPKYGKLIAERAKEADVCLLAKPTEVVAQADVIVAAVPGSKALSAALGSIAKLDSSKIYVDVSTCSPNTKKKIAEAVESKGASFVDGALMGALTLHQHKVPTIVSGCGSDKFLQFMKPYHMALSKISETPGDAIAVKLIRSIYMKGLATLSVEMLEAASTLKVESLVLKSVGDSINAATFEEMMNFLVTASAIHAERQAHEMSDVMEMLVEIGVDPTMTEATKKRLEWLKSKRLKEKFQGINPGKWEIVVQAWNS